MAPPVETSHFGVQQTLKSEYSPHVFTEYVSKRTGMRVVVVDQAGPKVQGYFTVATEIHDDSGSPHTLEHLCFMGSKHYPYKGLLDKLATRAYSTTNAWTATDHTAYTLETGGFDAFAQILPVYLEHVLLPTLTDDACYTEVFHVDGTGHDAGVVYSEMQGVQNQQSELIELRAKRLMYPEGVGFRYETGGMMERLRVLTAERIREFHRDLYQPKNLCVIVVGEVDHARLLSILDKFETEVVLPDMKINPDFQRPWVESVQPPPLKDSIVETVDFPDEDESIGEVSIRYFGTHCEDVLQTMAMEVLLGYLAGSSASVLENVLVEKEQLASAVYYQQNPRPNSVIEFTLTGVDAGQLSAVESRFLALIDETTSKPLDMNFMRDCIDKEDRQRKIQAERSESCFTSDIISTFLFSKSRSLKQLCTLASFEQLRDWKESDWVDLMTQRLSQNPRITILGRPSAELAERLKQDEKTRVEKQIEELGPKGLGDLAKKLASAKANNDKPIPENVLSSFKIPSTDTIHFISTSPAEAGRARSGHIENNKIQEIVDKDHIELPLYVHFEDIPSSFASINILVSTSHIPTALRPLLSIFTEYFFNQPVKRNGQRLEFEQTVIELQKDLVDYEFTTAGAMSCPEVLNIKINVETEKYETAIGWIRDLLWHGLFEIDRLKSTAAKILADVPEEKRSGSDMVYAVSDMTNDAPDSLRRAQGVLVKSVFLRRLIRLLDDQPEQALALFQLLRESIGNLGNMRVCVIADVSKLQGPVSSWQSFVKGQDSSKPLLPLDKREDRFSKAGMAPGNLCYVIPMSTIDSSFALASSKGPVDPRDPNVPALMTAIAYLDAVEGPLWSAVRGTGLAYGTSFCRRQGRLEYSVYSSPDACKAFSVSCKVVEDYISGATHFEDTALEGAVSSIVLALVNEQPTMETAAIDKFALQVVRELPRNWNDIILERIRSVKVPDIQRAMKELLLPLFRPESSNLFITIAPIMRDSTVDGLQSMGFKPEVRPLSFFEDDYGLKGDSGGSSGEDSDEFETSEEGSSWEDEP